MTKILSELRSFTSVRQRIIVKAARRARDSPSLQSLARDAILVSLIKSNPQERLLTPLVERLGLNITRAARDRLLTS